MWLGPVGQPRSVLAVLPRGHVWRSDDAGEAWALVGRAPVAQTSAVVWEALLDGEGRLIVVAPHNGSPVNGVFRTAAPIPVAAEAEPPEASGASAAHRAQSRPLAWRRFGSRWPRQRLPFV